MDVICFFRGADDFFSNEIDFFSLSLARVEMEDAPSFALSLPLSVFLHLISR